MENCRKWKMQRSGAPMSYLSMRRKCSRLSSPELKLDHVISIRDYDSPNPQSRKQSWALAKLNLMCGRYRLSAKERYIRDHLGLDEDPSWAPRYNIAPTQEVPIVRQDRNEPKGTFSTVR